MNYLSAISTITGALFTLLSLLTLHFLFFAIVGIFKKKTFPHAAEQLRYGVIIPARNEEAVIGNLIDSVHKCRYDQSKLQVFVIAHNCTDRTAEIARQHGATVYEYSNPDERTVGYAYRYLFRRIKQDHGTDAYDGFFIFNADNILDGDYFSRMNDAFLACDRKCVITSFRNAKNFSSNLLSMMYGLFFIYGCRYEARGRSCLGCSTRVQGTGFVINASLVKNGWPYVTLTEDWEFTVDQILKGTPIVYCDDAMFYDEQPTSLSVMWQQRLRWAKGHLLVCVTRMKDLMRGLFGKTTSDAPKGFRFWIYDITVNILPICLIGVGIQLLQLLLLLFAPLFGVSLWDAFLRQLLLSIPGTVTSYLAVVAASILLYCIEKDRIPPASLPKKILSVLLWPIFLFLSVPEEVVALFTRHVGWKTIPHTDTTDFESLNGSFDKAKRSEKEKEPIA